MDKVKRAKRTRALGILILLIGLPSAWYAIGNQDRDDPLSSTGLILLAAIGIAIVANTNQIIRRWSNIYELSEKELYSAISQSTNRFERGVWYKAQRGHSKKPRPWNSLYYLLRASIANKEIVAHQLYITAGYDRSLFIRSWNAHLPGGQSLDTVFIDSKAYEINSYTDVAVNLDLDLLEQHLESGLDIEISVNSRENRGVIKLPPNYLKSWVRKMHEVTNQSD